MQQTRYTLFSFCFFFLLNAGLFAQEWQELGRIEGAEQVTLMANDAGYNFAYIPATREYFRRHQDEIAWEPLEVPGFIAGPYYFNVGHGSNLYSYNFVDEEWSTSPDNGDSWEVMEFQLPIVTIELFKDLGNGRMILMDVNKIFLTNDGGETWEKVFTATQSAGFDKFVIHPVTGDYFVFSGAASQGAMIYTSSDAGATWTVFSILPNINDMTLDPESGLLYCATDEGIKRQVPGEGNFVLLEEQPVDIGVKRMDFLSTGRMMAVEKQSSYFGDVYFSDDTGGSWHKVAALEASQIGNFQVTPAGEIFGFRQGLICSKDHGATWQLDMDGINFGQIYDFAETTAGVQFVASNTGVFRTYNGGQSWERITRNFSRAIPAVEVDANDRLYIYRQNKLLVSDDEGDTFTEVDGPEIGYIYNYGEQMPKFLVHATGALFVLGKEEIYRSVDNGASWTSSPCPVESWGIQTTADGTIVIGHSSSFIVSQDVGETWSTQQTPNGTAPDANNFYVFKDGLITFVESSSQGLFLYKTEDFGMTWTSEQCTNNISSTARNFAINEAHYLFIPNFTATVKYSVDRGNHWLHLPNLPVNRAERVFYSNDHHIVTSSENGSILSYDVDLAILTGRIKYEEDQDCVAQDDDRPAEGWKVRATGGAFEYYGYTNSDGQFYMPTEKGDLFVEPLAPNHLWEVCTKDVTVSSQNLYSEYPIGDISVNALYQCPLMTVDVSTNFLRRCFDGMFSVRYRNTGTVTAENAYVVLEIDQFFEITSTDLPIASQDGRQFTFELGDVEPNKSGYFNVRFNISCDAVLSQWHCVEATVFPNDICGDFPEWTGSIIEVEGACQNDGTVFTITNVGDGDMVTSMPYFVHDIDGVIESGNYQLAAGESLTISVDRNDGLFIRLIDENGYPYQGIPSAVVTECDEAALLWDWAFSNLHLGNSEPFKSSFCMENRGSFDPNDKTAFPVGYGDDQLLEANVPIDYLIRFQNTGTDTAFKVVIVDTLSQWLDPSSIELGASSHPFTFDMSGSREDDGVVLKFIFDNIMLPDSNINEAASHGFVKFHVRQMPDNPIGTHIDNEAAIYFDFNEPIITNTVWHEIGEDFFPIVSDVKNEWATTAFLEIMPNPFNDETLIQLKGIDPGVHQIKIFDLAGKELFRDDFENTSYLLSDPVLPAGMLMVGIFRNGTPVVFEKLVKVKK
ncbi:MAG: hypothetical protein AAFZ15_05355 [Bacteroidota bacterium]